MAQQNIEQRDLDSLIGVIGSEIEQSQVKVVVAANAQTLLHYWRIGYIISYFQQQLGWGGKVIENISKRIKMEYPEKKGYSTRNLKYMCQFAKQYNIATIEKLIEIDADAVHLSICDVTNSVRLINEFEFTQEPLAQIAINPQNSENKGIDVYNSLPTIIGQEPLAQFEKCFVSSPITSVNWASHVILLDSKLPLGQRYWYMKQALEGGWSSTTLKSQIKSDLYNRQIREGKVNNFKNTLPAVHSDLANYLLKDPYIFDLVGAKESADERDIEEQLATHVTKYLLEMGSGFAFVARQKHFQVGDSDFYADLILYNIKLHAYVVIELKATPFKPEYAGQLNFYINVVDDNLRGENDNKTIGLLLCRGKDEVVAQYALSGYNQPIGVSDYELSKAIPENLKSTLPTVEEVEQELSSLLDNDKK